MKTTRILTTLILGLFLTPMLPAANPVTVPSGLSHTAWNQLVQKYVDEKGLVAYGKWQADSADRQKLEDYLAQFAPAPEQPAQGNEAAASLINLYNALTVSVIFENYPLDSIQTLSKPFATKRLKVGGQMISLNDIEHNTLRPQIGYRAHSVLVCAARSCPPLQREAYGAENLDSRIADAYRAWLARPDLNEFLPAENAAKISSIFSWFEEDFVQAGGVRKILAEYGPADQKEFLSGKGYEISYLPYNWGLNDQGEEGRSYSRIRLLWDRILNLITFWN